MQSIIRKINEVSCQFLSGRVLGLPDYNALCLADWHLGKAAHFRRSGIPLPQPDHRVQFELVRGLLNEYNVQTLYLLGDLFHSEINNDWNDFKAFRESISEIECILIRGNHDLIPDAVFADIDVFVCNQYWLEDQILLTHEPLDELSDSVTLNIAGHIHPGVEVSAGPRETYRFPCFYQYERTLLLPAFGPLTGLAIMPRRASGCIVGIAGNELLEIPLARQ